MSKNTLIITAIIVTLIAIGATATYITLRRQGGEEVRRDGGLATTTEPIDTSDWKSYESAKVGFSIDVPPEFDVSIDMSNPILLSPYRTRILSPEKEMTVEIYSLPGPDEEYTSFQDLIDREKRFFVSPPKEETIALNSVSGIKLSLHNEYGVGVIILMEKGQRYYKIGTVIKSESQDIYLPIFDKMLSTFKYID